MKINVLNKNNLFVISLPFRFDRRQHVCDQFKKYDLEFTFFDAINGHELEYSGPLKKGEEGIRQTHIALLNKAIDNNLDYIFICEDDVVFANNCFQILDTALSKLSNFDALYLGGNHLHFPTKIFDNIIRLNHTVAIHAIILHKNIFVEALQTIIENTNIPVDNAYTILQSKHNFYGIYPPIAWQKDDYSDIQSVFVKYDWLK